MWSTMYAFIISVSSLVLTYYSVLPFLIIFLLSLDLTNYLYINRPGQEEGNVPFVEDSGFGKYSGNPSIIADTVNEWLKSPEILQEMQSNALKAARPQATLNIARELGNMVFDYKDSKV